MGAMRRPSVTPKALCPAEAVHGAGGGPMQKGWLLPHHLSRQTVKTHMHLCPIFCSAPLGQCDRVGGAPSSTSGPVKHPENGPSPLRSKVRGPTQMASQSSSKNYMANTARASYQRLENSQVHLTAQHSVLVCEPPMKADSVQANEG